MLKKAVCVGAALLALGATLWAERPCPTVTGEITFKELSRKRIGIRNAEGRNRTYTVDDAAMPHWFDELQVSQRVTVTCKEIDDEHRPVATLIKPAAEEPKKP